MRDYKATAIDDNIREIFLAGQGGLVFLSKLELFVDLFGDLIAVQVKQ
jgi:hypothetical protein